MTNKRQLPKRQVVVDTETTGISVEDSHRVIETVCVEVINGLSTGEGLHGNINPGREIDPGAIEVHGITKEFLNILIRKYDETVFL